MEFLPYQTSKRNYLEQRCLVMCLLNSYLLNVKNFLLIENNFCYFVLVKAGQKVTIKMKALGRLRVSLCEQPFLALCQQNQI